ncbi:MAG: GTPase ObgE [Thermodesulfobacteriota bacterium]|nr:GTPase ObgE [Thermodesulfobacteriota bacterium]
MDFIDESTIYVKSGDGGKGCLSFRREKFVPKGGPDGGDGGKGGDITIEATPDVKTLLEQRYHPHYKSKRGQHGRGKNCTGKSGDNLTIHVPVGTIVRESPGGNIIADFLKSGDSVVIARGGKGGRGNARFATPTLQAPRYCEPGRPGEEKVLFLELKLLADVGLVGFPNAGKSTLISRVSKARPKIADYPFTTTTPNLGMVEWRGHDFVVADIPGIIKGAHKGVGLGIRFLRHIERTHIIVYVIDMSPETERDHVDELATLEEELGAYSETLLERPQIVALNKCDIQDASKKAKEVVAIITARGYPCFMISALSGKGINNMLDGIVRELVNTQVDRLKVED